MLVIKIKSNINLNNLTDVTVMDVNFIDDIDKDTPQHLKLKRDQFMTLEVKKECFINANMLRVLLKPGKQMLFSPIYTFTSLSIKKEDEDSVVIRPVFIKSQIEKDFWVSTIHYFKCCFETLDVGFQYGIPFSFDNNTREKLIKCDEPTLDDLIFNKIIESHYTTTINKTPPNFFFYNIQSNQVYAILDDIELKPLFDSEMDDYVILTHTPMKTLTWETKNDSQVRNLLANKYNIIVPSDLEPKSKKGFQRIPRSVSEIEEEYKKIMTSLNNLQKLGIIEIFKEEAY
jgi:hypothetical protein